ncbi:MAG: hypothetical protein AAGI01_10565, partial [Myxococcota bacterium]
SRWGQDTSETAILRIFPALATLRGERPKEAWGWMRRVMARAVVALASTGQADDPHDASRPYDAWGGVPPG